MKNFFFVLVVAIFCSSLAGAKNSYLLNKVLVNGTYEQIAYPNQDVVYLQPGETYSTSYYLNTQFVSGKMTVEILSAPDYLEFKPVFNDSTASGFHFYWANNESGQEAYFQTDITDNGFSSSWFCFRYPSGWLGDIEFVNNLQAGDSIQYLISTVCSGPNGQSYQNHHLRTIKCAITDGGLKIGQSIDPSELAHPQITAYPNPFSGELIINSFQIAPMAILDITGRVLESFQLQIGLNRIPTLGLKPGIYFAKAGNTVVKLIKK